MALTLSGLITAAPKLPGAVSVGYSVSAAGVVASGSRFLAKLTCQIGGSITLNDCSSTAAAAITNQIIAVTMAAGAVITLNWPCLLGVCVSSASGTFALTFT